MNKTILLILFFISLFLFSVSFIALKHSSGHAGSTGSPFEGTCANCHSGGTGLTTVSISANPAFANNEYIPGQTYTVDITISNTNFLNFGFACEILNTFNTNAGNMTTALSGVKFLNSSGRKNATHNATKSGAGSAVFSFIWLAPASGTAIVYAVGNSVNGNGNTSGDATGVTSLTLTETISSLVTETKKEITQLTIFPNPAFVAFEISYTKHNHGKTEGYLYDMNGKQVFELFSEDAPSGNYHKKIQLPDDFIKGVYFIQIIHNKTPAAKRLIVLQ